IPDGVGCNAPWGVPFDDKIYEGLSCNSGGITVNASVPVSVGWFARLFLFVVFCDAILRFCDDIVDVDDDNSDGDRDWWKFLSCFGDDNLWIWIVSGGSLMVRCDGNGSLGGEGFYEDGLMLKWF
ncbi:unnamed protein product, partial [Anisakis simplex]|uniref:LNR domain-containing protein n=1 Tax=Anisakis simplex TaxID=6269 RepID=A0A0M3KD11_ANISI